MHKLRGCGLNNVYIKNGYKLENVDGLDTVAYFDLPNLYKQLARAISLRKDTLNAEEFRFLHKRLGSSQAEVGAIGDKTEQAVAKWEKGTQPVPKAEANLLRLKVLDALGFRADLAKVVGQLSADGSEDDSPYVFSYLNGKWTEDNAALVADVAAIANQVLYTIGNSAAAKGAIYTRGKFTHGELRVPNIILSGANS